MAAEVVRETLRSPSRRGGSERCGPALTTLRSAQRPMGESMTRRQKLVLMNALMLCMFVAALDHAIISTAMPKILADLGGFHLLSWVFTTYLLASTVVVSVVGKLSDMFGPKSFLLGGIAVFVVGSVACALSPSMPFLIGARTVQGAGGGVIFACVFATLGDLFTPIERVKYVGYFTGTFTLSALTGPTIGGFLTDGPGWRWCFYVNVPVGLIAAVLLWFAMPAVRKGGRLANVDFLGALLLGSATTAFMLSLLWARAAYGPAAPQTLGLLGLSLVLGAAFIAQERRHPEAILPLFLFKNRVFVQATLILMSVGGGIFASIQFLPTFIQTSLGTSATVSGLVATPQAVGVLITSIVGGQIAGRTGRYKRAVVIGSAMVLLGTAPMLTLGIGSTPLIIALYMALIGLGLGLVMPIMSTVVQNSVPQELVGVASSSRQFFMSIVQVVGVAVFGLVFTSGYASAFEAEAEVREALAPAVYAQFLDPTLALDAGRFAAVRGALLQQPGGEAQLDRTLAAQRAAVSSSTHRLFVITTVIAAMMLAFAVTLREVPLRRSFGATPSGRDRAAGRCRTGGPVDR